MSAEIEAIPVPMGVMASFRSASHPSLRPEHGHDNDSAHFRVASPISLVQHSMDICGIRRYRKPVSSRQSLDIPSNHLYRILRVTALLAETTSTAVTAIHTRGSTSISE